MKRTRTLIAALLLLLSLCGALGLHSVERAYGALDKTISGTAEVTITNKDAAWGGEVARCEAVLTLPDGTKQVVTGRCVSGDSYAYPVDGTYSYTGTLNADGTYSVVIDSSTGKPANAGAFNPGGMKGVQKLGDIIISYRPKVTVTFTKTSADASLSANNEHYALAGAGYDIFEASNGTKVGSITTGADGRASLELDPNTAYYAIETKAPMGYKLSDKRISFTTGTDDTDVALKDQPGTVTVKIIKRDAATGGDAQAGLSLEDAEFSIVDHAGRTHTATTDRNGEARCENLPLGRVTVTETKAPEGYLCDPVPRTYTVSATGEIATKGVIELDVDDIYEVPVSFDIEIAKFKGENVDWENQDGHAKPAEGVRFDIVSNTTNETVASISTNENGFASTKDVDCTPAGADDAKALRNDCRPWYGDGERVEGMAGALPYDPQGYIVREDPATVPHGFAKVKDWTIPASSLANGAILQFICDDHGIETRIQLVKVDAATNETVPLAGFSFQLHDASGSLVRQTSYYPAETVIDTFTTDEHGQVTLPQRLKPGSYTVHEIAAMPPYLISEPLKVEISGDQAQAVAKAVVRVADKQATGRASIIKTCATGSEGIEGAEFDVVALEDIISPTGTVFASKDEVIDHVTCDKNGHATTTEPLCLGTGTARYAFVETRSAAGHALDPTPHPFTLSYKDAYTPIVEATVAATNEPTTVLIEKVDMETGDPLAGAVFEIIWKDSGEPKSGKKDISTATTGENGIAVLNHLPSGTYVIREISAPARYVVDSSEHIIKVDEDGLIDGKCLFTLHVEDDFTKIDISKRDATDEREVAGAKLALTDSDGVVIDQWISDGDEHRVERIVPGTYTLTELSTPNTHDLADPITFTVEDTGEVQKAVMYDQPIKVDGSVDKRQQIADPIAVGTDENGDGENRASVTLSQAGEYLYTLDARNASSTWVDEFTVTDELEGVKDGLAILDGVTTPQATGDYDGLCNLWYRTSETPADYRDPRGANATIDDRHENSWLTCEYGINRLGEDGRSVDYAGWRLWQSGIPLDEAQRLDVKSLDLANGEVITAIRVEFGRVEAGFTTREKQWDRDDLKDAHDDMDEPFQDDAGSPIILHMRVTQAYREDAELDNKAALDLMRNAGGDDLESHDADAVRQIAKTPVVPLPQTGALGPTALISLTCAGSVVGGMVVLNHVNRTRNRSRT